MKKRMEKENFETLKAEILRRAKEAQACTKEYGRAYKAKTMTELCSVIKDNFIWCCYNKVLESGILEIYADEFRAENIFFNEDTSAEFLYASGNATVRASGNATVRASGNATVRASGNATVEAYDNATVRAYGNATVEAYGNATVEAYDNATVRAYDNVYCTSFLKINCQLHDNSIYRVRSTNIIYYGSESIGFEQQQNPNQNKER